MVQLDEAKVVEALQSIAKSLEIIAKGFEVARKMDKEKDDDDEKSLLGELMDLVK